MVPSVRVCTHCASVYIEEVEFCGIDGAPLVQQDEDPLLTKSLERYVITEFLGAGGMGRVYRAGHQHFDREYAVKVLYGDLAANKGSVRRFQREAEATGALDHPNVVSVFDFGQSGEGLFFLVMELVHGRTLKDAIEQDGLFGSERTRAVIRQVAEGLKAAHDKGIVHRDLKPANIMLVEKDGLEHVKIVDFGLAGLVEDNDVLQSKLTSTGSTLGTPAYMAPEQALGSKVTRTADLYSLGVVLYEMLSGKLPFGSPSPDMLMKKMVSIPPPLPGEGPLQLVTAQLLTPVPERRPQSVDVLIRALDGEMPEASQPELPVLAEPTVPVQPPKNRGRGRIWGLAGGLMGLGGLTLWLAWPAQITTVAAPPKPSLAKPRPVLPAAQPGAAEPKLMPSESKVAAAPKLHLRARPAKEPEPPVVRPAPATRQARIRSKATSAPPKVGASARSKATVPPEITAQPEATVRPEATVQPKPEVRGATIEALDASLVGALRKRGLSMGELALLTGISGPLEAWSRARESAPALEATAKLQKLLLAVGAADIPLGMLEAKLDRIGTALERAGKSAAPADLRRLEDRYFDLSSRVGGRPGKTVRAELATALFKLERSVGRL